MPTCWCIRSRKRRGQIPPVPASRCQVSSRDLQFKISHILWCSFIYFFLTQRILILNDSQLIPLELGCTAINIFKSLKAAGVPVDARSIVHSHRAPSSTLIISWRLSIVESLCFSYLNSEHKLRTQTSIQNDSLVPLLWRCNHLIEEMVRGSEPPEPRHRRHQLLT